ncbi:MAG: metallophosphoesterase [Lentisphaeria bacterium]|nr:metallophosphoesterase [Lentisphaeria bacterium]
MSSVKFLAFADLHHYPEVFYTFAPERLAAIRQRAIDEKVDFVISLGDFGGGKPLDLLAEYAAFPMKTYHVFGNHDTDNMTLTEAIKAFDMPGKGYYFFDCNGFRFIILDNNYVNIDGSILHFELGNYFPHPNTREILPAEQVDFLKETVGASPYPCILFSHSSIERECDQTPGRPFRSAIINRQEIIDVINQANSRSPGKVRMAINGHYHRDFLRILDQVVFLDLNSASMEWVNNPHDHFDRELTAKHTYAANTVIYNEPLCAVITLDHDGTLQIDGMKGSFYKNVTREMTDNPPCDRSGRPCTANIQSVKMKMFYR